MSLSFKSLGLAVILSIVVYGAISQFFVFEFPKQTAIPNPHFIFWGSLLTSDDIEDHTFDPPASLLSSNVDLNGGAEKNPPVNLMMSLEKPLSPKVKTEKQNLKSSFENVEIQNSPREEGMKDEFLNTPLKSYKSLRFP